VGHDDRAVDEFQGLSDGRGRGMGEVDDHVRRIGLPKGNLPGCPTKCSP
jgi:hypothetical protein